MDWLSVVGIVAAVIVGIWIMLYLYGAHLGRKFKALTPEEQDLELAKREALRVEGLARKAKRTALRAEAARESEERQATKRQHRINGRSSAEVERERRAALRTARKPLVQVRSAAERDYSRRIGDAEFAFRKRKDEADPRLKAAERRAAEAEMVGRERVVSFSGLDGSVVAEANSLTINGKTFVMNTSVRASVDTGGNFSQHSRSTLTRMAAGGLLLGPVGMLAGGMVKKSQNADLRELYLLIEGDDFAAAITCNPNLGSAARQAAAAINQAAKTSVGLEKRRSEAISSAKEALRSALEQHARDLAQASDELASAKARPKELDNAIAALDAFDAENKDQNVEPSSRQKLK